MSNHRFPYEWSTQNYPKETVGTVFSTFSCGGGSTMGYKLAGFDVLGCLEIDDELVSVYRTNHNPTLCYNEDIRDFRRRDDLPDELYDLDILDGSPPCSTFSTAGNREKDWNREKKFKEGQATQRLDDLFGEFIELAARLQPKVVVSENVTGMIKGHAKGYVKEIARGFDEAGYTLQVFVLNAATMGVPQKRRRVFPIARRKDLEWSDLSLSFNETPIKYGEIREKGANGYKEMTAHEKRLWDERLPSERTAAQENERVRGVVSGFTWIFEDDHRVCSPIIAGPASICVEERRFLYVNEMMLASSFPTDYNFGSLDPRYVMGMSVPPVMMAQIATEIKRQWLADNS